jgi:CrcB protein
MDVVLHAGLMATAAMEIVPDAGLVATVATDLGQSAALVAIAAAGAAIGALVRVLLCDWFVRQRWRVWLGVVAVNVVGSAAAGITGVMLQSGSFWWAAIGVGALGGLTTMSAVAFEAVALLAERRRAQAAVMLALNLVLCPCAAWVGMRMMAT